MKVISWTKYGPPEVLQLKEIEKPVPRDKELLVKVYATTVTAGDCEMRSLKFPFLLSFSMRVYNGLRAPKRLTILGQELSGVVEEVGRSKRELCAQGRRTVVLRVHENARGHPGCLDMGRADRGAYAIARAVRDCRRL